jgi:hypothetical protein
MRTARVTSHRRLLPVFIILLIMMACAHEKLDESLISEPFVRERWLSYLEDGKTKQDEIIRRLGEPISRFQNGTILGYRLILVEEGRDISENEYRSSILNRDSAYIGGYYAWVNNQRKLLSEKGTLFTLREENKDDRILEILSREAEYSLVLVFDDQGTLAKHNLRRIMP